MKGQNRTSECNLQESLFIYIFLAITNFKRRDLRSDSGITGAGLDPSQNQITSCPLLRVLE
jgi:hypothetical protein